MKRVVALFLPDWPIERLRQAERTRAQPQPPEASPSAQLDALRNAAAAEQEHACSVPRGGGWRPGARWAREEVPQRVALPPVVRLPAKHEAGRRDEAAAHPFKPMRSDEVRSQVPAGASPTQFLPQLAGGGGPSRSDGGGAAPQARNVRQPTTAAARPPLHPALRARSPSPSKLGEELVPLLTSVRSGNRQIVAAACPAARALGLVPGMAVAQARALTPGLDIRPANPSDDLAALRQLAILIARHWCPVVTMDGDDGLLLDITGTAHLFGGEAAMARRLMRMLARFGFTGRVAVADTAGAARALARHAPGRLCPPGHHEEAIASLPAAALRIDPAAVELLRRLGVERIGQLAVMPRAPLVRRFGIALVTELDRTLGRLPEPLDPVIAPEAIVVRQRFAEPIATAEAIAHWLGQLVPPLAAALEAQGLGARAIECIAERVDGVPQRIRIGLARPSREPAHLLRLLVRRIEDIAPGYGIDALALHVRRAAPLGPEPVTERLDEQAAPDIATLVDTLATRIGMPRMWRLRAVESDVPERAVARAALLDPPERGGPRPRIDAVGQLDRSAMHDPWHAQWPKPARLLRRPELLDHVVAELPDQPPRRFTWRGQPHSVVRADGPERIHGEWWRSPAEYDAVRDYFRVEDSDGRRYWLFRRGDGERQLTGDLSWYLHGVFG